MNDDFDLTPEELDRQTKLAAKSFFQWNSGKNTPNILQMLAESVSDLNKTVHITTITAAEKMEALTTAIRESSVSAEKQGARLNRLTKAYVWLTACIVIATAIQIWLALNKT